MKTKAIQFNNEHLRQVLVVEHAQNFKPIEKQQQEENYFLICEGCFWMASTLSHIKSNNILPTIYKECPVCESKIDRFTIPPPPSPDSN